MNTVKKEYTLKNRLFLTTAFLIFCSVAVISTLGTLKYRQYFIHQTFLQTQELVEQMSFNTASYIDELSRLSLSPYYSRTIMQTLESNPINPTDRLNKKRKIENYLKEVMTIPRKEILRVYIISDDIYSSTRTSH